MGRQRPLRDPGLRTRHRWCAVPAVYLIAHGDQHRTVPGMEPELAARTAAEARRLAGPRPVGDETATTYLSNLRSWWVPYAHRHNLSEDFTAPDARPLTLEEVTALVGAASLGELRKGTRDGEQSRSGKPMAPATLEGLLSALRWIHLHAGLTWVGEAHQAELAQLRQGYRNTHAAGQVRARRMSQDDVGDLFDHPPIATDGAGFWENVARALSLQASVPLVYGLWLRPRDITIEGDHAVVESKYIVQCVASSTNDPLLGIVCAHCLVIRWKNEAEPDSTLLTDVMLDRARLDALALASKVNHVSFVDDVLRVRGPIPLATMVALCVSPAGVEWLTARALLLPMRSLGLGFNDLAKLPTSDIHFGAQVTFTPARDPRDRPAEMTIQPTGGARCPVSAMAMYDAWASCFLPNRRQFLVALRRGKGQHVRYAIETTAPEGSRARYQWLSGWLRENAVEGSDDGGVSTRRNLTTRSAQRGFAQAAHDAGHDAFTISLALGHSRVGTTLRAIDAPSPAAGQVLKAIALGRPDDEQ